MKLIKLKSILAGSIIPFIITPLISYSNTKGGSLNSIIGNSLNRPSYALNLEKSNYPLQKQKILKWLKDSGFKHPKKTLEEFVNGLKLDEKGRPIIRKFGGGIRAFYSKDGIYASNWLDKESYQSLNTTYSYEEPNKTEDYPENPEQLMQMMLTADENKDFNFEGGLFGGEGSSLGR